MAGNSINTGASLTCPHGGTASISSTNTSVNADGAAVALMSDTTTISGCPWQIPAAPSPIPDPCIRVQWIVADARVLINGTPTLSQSSVGLCISAMGIPAGPVTVQNTQSAVSSQ